MSVRVVVVGNSYGAYCQLPALRWCASRGAAVEVTAIVGRGLAKAQATAARFAIPLATTSLTEALASKPQLVLVSTPVDLHAPMVAEVLATSTAAIVCEKPFTLDVESARALAGQAQRDGRLALVDHQLRFSPPRQRFRQLVREGAVGTPWVARAEMCFGSLERLTRKASWWDQRERGGGAMQAIGSHLVDGLVWILGPVVDVQARLTSCTRQRADDAGALQPVTADDHCELWLTHAGGARSTVLCTTVQTHGRRSLLEVIGSRGVLRLVDEEQLGLGVHDASGPGSFKNIDVRLPSVAEVDACNDSAFARSEPLLLRAVLAAVARGDGSLEGAATFHDGAAVVEVLAAARA